MHLVDSAQTITPGGLQGLDRLAPRAPSPGNIRHNLPQLPSSMAYQISFMLLYFSLLFIGRTDLAVCVDGPMLLPPA